MSEQEIFAAAIRLTGTARAAFLSEACTGDAQLRQHVEALLKAHEESGGIVRRQMGRDLDPTMIPDFSVTQQIVQPGTLIGGRYKLIEAIGEGGMDSADTSVLPHFIPDQRHHSCIKRLMGSAGS